MSTTLCLIGWPRQLETELAAMKARAEKAEASLHNLNLDLSTANHMIKLERDRADTLQARLNEIDAMLNSPETF
jgi:predicted nuclease with TOPRIM domain